MRKVRQQTEVTDNPFKLTMDLKNRKALVTGGSAGIGKAIVLDLAAHGADVAFTYIGPEAPRVKKAVAALGRKCLSFESNVSQFSEAGKVTSLVVEKLGGLDILVNNAGINRDGVVWKMTEEMWDQVLETDLKGCFNYIRAAAPVFKRQKSGKIVNISSINGLRGKFGQSNYAAAKAGVIGLTKAVAKELGAYNVNVNAVAPGFVETEMTQKLPEKIKKKALDETVFKRFGKPEEIAHLVSFLCSEKARHITGEVIKIDGGQCI